MRVRKLTPDDIETLRTIRIESLRSDPDAFGSTLAREEGRTDDDWRSWLGRGATFVAEDDEGPVGLVVVIAHDPPPAGIYAMFVSPRARRGGVGKALVEAALAWSDAVGAPETALLVVDGNTAAITLYESCGFAFTGRTEIRERDGVVEREMARVSRTRR